MQRDREKQVVTLLLDRFNLFILRGLTCFAGNNAFFILLLIFFLSFFVLLVWSSFNAFLFHFLVILKIYSTSWFENAALFEKRGDKLYKMVTLHGHVFLILSFLIFFFPFFHLGMLLIFFNRGVARHFKLGGGRGLMNQCQKKVPQPNFKICLKMSFLQQLWMHSNMSRTFI